MNTEIMKRFEELEPEILEKIEGGFWSIPYKNLLSSICGFVDGFNGKKNKGSC